MTTATVKYDVYLIHADGDADWVEDRIAKPLKDRERLNPWLYKWDAIPGNTWLKNMEAGLKNAKSCAVCLSASGPKGRFEKAYEAAQTQKQQNDLFCVLPVLLPSAKDEDIPLFLQAIDTIDLRDVEKFEEMFYRLVCGIKGMAPGPWQPPSTKAKQAKPDDQYRIELELNIVLSQVKGLEESGVIDKETAKNWRDGAFEDFRKKINQNLSRQPITVSDGSR